MISSKLIQLTGKLLQQCDTNETHLAPTIYLNEGWMVRIMTSVSIEMRLQLKKIDFGKMANWYSEGLLASPFLPVCQKDKLAEGYTHADLALGDFTVNGKKRGDIRIVRENGHFGIIEAKMKSPLSSGTTHAPGYDQASRNLACIAFNTLKTRHKIFFAVVAPHATIENHGIRRKINHDTMIAKIAKRFDSYNDPATLSGVPDSVAAKYRAIFQLKKGTLARATSAVCEVVSFEEWLEEIQRKDKDIYLELLNFYTLCKKYNRIQ